MQNITLSPTIWSTEAPAAANPLAPEPDERDAIIASMQAALAEVEARARAMEAELAARLSARRVEPAPFPGELHRERVDDTTLVYCAETYRDLPMVACYAVGDDGRRRNKPVYSKSRDKALDAVYRAAVAGVHRLHEEQA